jgi:uncharacterized protein YxjI
MAELRSYPTPLGIFPAFITQELQTIVLQDKIFNLAGDYDIKLIDGTPLFKIQGKSFSMSGRRKFMDMEGNHRK